jgi:hypothetical protein
VYFSQLPAQYVPADCERVRSDLDASLRYRLLEPIAALDRPFARVGYGRCDSDDPCRAVLAVRAQVGHGARSTGPLLARRAVRLAAGGFERPKPMLLTARGRDLLARRQSIRVRIGFLYRRRLVDGFAFRLARAEP